MTDPGDRRLERALREALAARRAGAAPAALRAGVERIPREVTARRVRTSSIVQGLATAAVLVLAVGGLIALRIAGLGSGGPVASAGVPAPTFDPSVAGSGLVTDPDRGLLWPVVVLAGVAIGVGALLQRGWWRRRLLVIPGLALLAWAGIGTFAPLSIDVVGYGPGIGLRLAVQPVGSEGEIAYVVAGPSAPYAFALMFETSGPLPIRIDGLDTSMINPPAGPHVTRPIGLWLDQEPQGLGFTGPGTTFAPVTIPPDTRAIWFVYRTSDCMVGPIGPEESIGPGGTFSIQSTVRLRLSILGWPRSEDVSIPIHIVAPSSPCG